MRLDPMEPAIEILNEVTVLRKLLKIRIEDKLKQNNALLILTPDEAICFVMDTDKGIANIINDLTAANDLLAEHLDYFIPTPKMWGELVKY